MGNFPRLRPEGDMTVEGPVVDLINGLDGVRSDSFRFCNLRGPAGIIVELAEKVG
ncbi:hypothetical protein ACIRSS_35875 [Amycolatopsis sp. NPDC101161]|uniref:hypothetical protein n=1 Tax=Amycolatopsis sp. NPDC101161 TaxID=3363940 RepID=UPI00381E4B3E